jgi:hypothetical protein
LRALVARYREPCDIDGAILALALAEAYDRAVAQSASEKLGDAA